MTGLFEELAAIEHGPWADWQRYMHSKGRRVNGDYSVTTGDLILPSVLVEQWERQIDTLYGDLSEREKDGDRDQVLRYWHLITQSEVEFKTTKDKGTPHKCPICNGGGLSNTSSTSVFEACTSCMGSGILWSNL